MPRPLSCRDGLEAGGVADTPTEACSDRSESALFDLGEEDIVLVGELLVVASDLADHAMCADTIGAFGVVFA